MNSQHFATRFNLIPLGVHSGATGAKLTGNISSTTLNPGDVVLVQGTSEAIGNLKSNSNMLVIEKDTLDLAAKRSFFPLYMMLGVTLMAATSIMPISVAAMIGLLVMLLAGALRWSDVGNSMNIPVIMLIVASLSLGTALEITGGGGTGAAGEVVVNGSLTSFVVTNQGSGYTESPLVSIVGNLNEDYEGSEFHCRDKEIKLKTGDILSLIHI